MTRASRMAHAGQRLLRLAIIVLGGGVLSTALLVVTATAAQTGGLLDRLFPGKGSQRSEGPPSQGTGPLATIRLTVEGMVCYG